VILGTRACEHPEELARLVEKFGGEKIAVGIDARDGKVQTKGWVETTDIEAVDLAKQVDKAGVGTIIYTDTACDGMLGGVNAFEMGKICSAVSCNVVASGGVSSVEDIKRLAALNCANLTGAGMGMMIGLTFHAIGLAGAVLSPQTGYAFSEVLDPQNQASASALSGYFYLIGLPFFVAIDGHLLIVKSLAESYRLLPLGQWEMTNGYMDFIIRGGAGMFVIGFTIAMPILAVVLFINAGLSMLARAVPQMNIFVVGFIFMISSGLVATALFLPYYGTYLTERLMEALEQMLWLLKTR